MARSAAQAQKRQQLLLRTLARGRRISTVHAARRFSVNEMTIRRDLRALQESGAVVRCYGGAVAAQRITLEFAFDERHRRHLAEKKRIGAAAAGLVKAGQSIFLDTGTTTLEVARALAARGVACRVATSSLVIAAALWGQAQLQLMLTGGQVRGHSPDLIGPAAVLVLKMLTADLAILGSDGIDPARGCFAADLETAAVDSTMAANARKVVVVADSSKLGQAGGAHFLDLGAVRELITGRKADPGVLRAIRKKGVAVTLV